MDKNEILEKSRQENQKQDEHEKDVHIKAFRIAVIVAAILCMIFIFIEDNNSYLIILDSMCMAMWGYRALKLKGKSDIISFIIWIIIFILSFVLYIINKCGL